MKIDLSLLDMTDQSPISRAGSGPNITWK